MDAWCPYLYGRSHGPRAKRNIASIDEFSGSLLWFGCKLRGRGRTSGGRHFCPLAPLRQWHKAQTQLKLKSWRPGPTSHIGSDVHQLAQNRLGWGVGPMRRRRLQGLLLGHWARVRGNWPSWLFFLFFLFLIVLFYVFPFQILAQIKFKEIQIWVFKNKRNDVAWNGYIYIYIILDAFICKVNVSNMQCIFKTKKYILKL